MVAGLGCGSNPASLGPFSAQGTGAMAWKSS